MKSRSYWALPLWRSKLKLLAVLNPISSIRAAALIIVFYSAAASGAWEREQAKASHWLKIAAAQDSPEAEEKLKILKTSSMKDIASFRLNLSNVPSDETMLGITPSISAT